MVIGIDKFQFIDKYMQNILKTAWIFKENIQAVSNYLNIVFNT